MTGTERGEGDLNWENERVMFVFVMSSINKRLPNGWMIILSKLHVLWMVFSHVSAQPLG